MSDTDLQFQLEALARRLEREKPGHPAIAALRGGGGGMFLEHEQGEIVRSLLDRCTGIEHNLRVRFPNRPGTLEIPMEPGLYGRIQKLKLGEKKRSTFISIKVKGLTEEQQATANRIIERALKKITEGNSYV